MATVTKADKPLIVALGPVMLEIIQLTAVVNDDTITSRLANPTHAFMVPAADAAATTQNQSVTISGRTLTLRDPAVTAQTVFVIGNGLA